MLKKIKNGIKIFLGLLVTFILSLFFKEKRNTSSKTNNILNRNQNKEITTKSNKNGITINDRDESGKSLGGSLYNNELKYSKSSIKYDLQKVFYIYKTLEKLEQEIKNSTELEELEYLQKKIKKEETNLDNLSTKYEDILIKNEEIVEIKELTKKCRKEIDKNLDKIDNKIYSIKKEKNIKDIEKVNKNHEDYKEMPEVNILLTPVIKIKKIKLEKDKNIKGNKQIVKDYDKYKDKEQQEDKVTTKIDNLILDAIIIKKTIDFIDKENIINDKLKNDEKQDVLVKEKESKEIRVHQKDLNGYKLRIDTLKRNLNSLKIKNTRNNIFKVLKNTSFLVNSFNPLMVSNKSKLIATSLIINNRLRQARKINNKNIKYLKYEKVILKVKSKNNYNLQLKYIMNDTLIQIRMLRCELNNLYKLDDSLLDLIYQLNEIEAELSAKMEQINMMENSNENEKKIVLR